MKNRFTLYSLKTNKLFCITLFALFLTAPSFVSAQKQPNLSMSQVRTLGPEQKQALVAQAKNQGYTLPQLEAVARLQGATTIDLKEIRLLWAGDSSSEATPTQNTEEGVISQFGITTQTPKAEQINEQISSAIFGSTFFNNPNISESPQLYVATPLGYRLGPGDKLTIDLWGASEKRYEAVISREGVIKLDRMAPLYLSGLNLSKAESKLRHALDGLYDGLSQKSDAKNKVYLDLSLSKARTIIINITGNVNAPGTYTLSGFSTILNALYAAGGPNENGSYRSIDILRGGRKAATIDLYDYFVKGKYPSFSLNDQDVIVVAPYTSRIRLRGAFKTKGFFEAKPNESLQDIISFAGGFSSDAFKEAIYVDRITARERSVTKFKSDQYDQQPAVDGDVVEAKQVSDKYTNRVLIQGAVYLPGSYPIEETPTLSALLLTANNVQPDAYTESALLYRTNKGIENQMISVDLAAVLSGIIDIDLKENDRLVILFAEQVDTKKEVTIQGFVNNSGKFNYYKGMTALDLILLANGFKDKANTAAIEIYRNQSTLLLSQKMSTFSIPFDDAQKIALEPSDLIVVRKLAGYQQTESVSIQGKVLIPGTYAIKSDDYSVFDLMEDAGGTLDSANLKGVSITRVIQNQDKKNISEGISDSLMVLPTKQLTIGIDAAAILETKGNHPHNIELNAQDVVFVPKTDTTVMVLGEVQKETVITYNTKLTVNKAINESGGYTANAKKRMAYVVYQNGTVRATKSFLFFKNRPYLEPGAIIVVPVRQKRNKMSIQETLSITSAVASLTILIRTLTNN